MASKSSGMAKTASRAVVVVLLAILHFHHVSSVHPPQNITTGDPIRTLDNRVPLSVAVLRVVSPVDGSFRTTALRF